MRDKAKRYKRQRRALRVRRRLRAVSPERLRLSVFRSHQHIYAQLIDDLKGVTLASASDFELKNTAGLTKTDKAYQVGRLLSDKIKGLKVKRGIVFDKGPYAFHGRVKALVEGLRQGGVKI